MSKGHWFLDRKTTKGRNSYLKKHPNSRYGKKAQQLTGDRYIPADRDTTASKQQHKEQRANVQNSKNVKTAQDSNMRRQQQITKLQKTLANLKPSKSAKGNSALVERRRTLMAKIKDVRDSIRSTSQRIMKMRGSK